MSITKPKKQAERIVIKPYYNCDYKGYVYFPSGLCKKIGWEKGKTKIKIIETEEGLVFREAGIFENNSKFIHNLPKNGSLFVYTNELFMKYLGEFSDFKIINNEILIEFPETT